MNSTRVEMIGEPFDRAVLACCIPPLEQQDRFLAPFLDPVPQLDQFDPHQP
jgi:hypothetical protein